MKKLKKIGVSDLKAKLLEIVRKVEKGQEFEITKNGNPIAILSPYKAAGFSVGFAKIKTNKNLDLEEVHGTWTYDLTNLKNK